ncbi:MAG TPA: arylamine N-acetyltransferase [Pyrinomonadaceae bacterium]|jgi:N-hydroxyarylamine O-acetyltransferase
MDTTAYLQRINYDGPMDVSAETLRALQLAHLETVPFENLSIHTGQPIVLNDEALFEKVVNRRRGGFCYELNGLFAALLRALGFDVTMLSAGVFNSEGELGPDFDHMTLMVTLDQRWLVDVGFGDSFREPLLLDELGDQLQGERAYRIVSDNDHLKLLQRNFEGDWQAQYQFTLRGFNFSDYAGMCHFHQTSPQSHFTRKRVCTIATRQGRITLSDMRLITTLASGERHEREVRDNEEYSTLLKEHFGISAI